MRLGHIQQRILEFILSVFEQVILCIMAICICALFVILVSGSTRSTIADAFRQLSTSYCGVLLPCHFLQ